MYKLFGVIGLMLLLAACGGRPTAVPSQTPTSTLEILPTQPGFSLATLNEPVNLVQTRPGEGVAFVSAKAGDALQPGAQVQTGSSSQARLNYSTTSTLLRFGPQTLVTLRERGNRDGSLLDHLMLTNGKIWISLNWGLYEVETPVGIVTVTGSFAVVDYRPGSAATFEDDVLVVDCIEGHCTLSRGGTSAELKNLERFELTHTALVRSPLSDADVSAFVQMNPESTRVMTTLTAGAPTATPTATPTSTSSSTYTPLPTSTPTISSTPTLGPTATRTRTRTPTIPPTTTRTATATLTRTATITPTRTSTGAITHTPTASQTGTSTLTPTITNTPTETSTPTVTLTPTPTLVATIVVNNFSDGTDINPGNSACETGPGNGICTLRAAIMEANARLGAQTITFSQSGTYNLSIPGSDENASLTGDLDITDALTIIGAGVDQTIISSGVLSPTDRVIHIPASGIAVTISDLTITGGSVSDFGGGLYNQDGTLILDRVTISGNTANSGGGLANFGAGLVTLTDVTLSNNTFAGEGGGLYNGGTATLNRVTINGNNGNSGTMRGGGLFNSGTANLTNVTISGNTLNSTTTAEGGGIYNSATATLTNVTIAFNSVAGPTLNGASTFHVVGASTMLTNTIVADGTGASNCNVDLTGTANYSLTDDVACLMNGVNNNIVGAAGLDLLANYGGDTETHLLQATSLAINIGDNAVCIAPPVSSKDQRNFDRTDGSCDIGSVERQPTDP